MKTIMLAAAAALAIGATDAALAQSESSRNEISPAAPTIGMPMPSSAASLRTLLAEWDRAGFVTPSKPGQYRVYGRNGYVTNGPGYFAMVSLIRSATRDVQEGRDRNAQIKIANARGLLAASNSERANHG
jgi:hypothetical protein